MNNNFNYEQNIMSNPEYSDTSDEYDENSNDNDVDKYVDNIVNIKLNNGKKKFISKISPDINFRYNSFNLCIGPQGSSKSTSVMKELMKLSLVPNDYHLIIYVNNNSSDDTFTSLVNYINIPVVKTDYENVEKQCEELFKLKDEYNKMVDGEIEKDDSILQYLYVDNFDKQRLHTFILFDDASFIFDKTSKSKFKSWFCQCRHLNITVFACIQIFNSMDAKLKSQLSTVFLFKGFSRERLQLIYRQCCIDMSFSDFFNYYMRLKKYQKIIIDNIDCSLCIK